LFCSMKEDVIAIYIHLRQTLICRSAITSVAGSVPQPLTVSYLVQNSRLLDDNCGLLVGS
jgi:hypothetical protein